MSPNTPIGRLARARRLTTKLYEQEDRTPARKSETPQQEDPKKVPDQPEQDIRNVKRKTRPRKESHYEKCLSTGRLKLKQVTRNLIGRPSPERRLANSDSTSETQEKESPQKRSLIKKNVSQQED